MIERVHLEIISALIEEGSLTRAADKLGLTQPALTHSIKKLENLLGCKIWYKDGRLLKLTKYGEYLHNRAKKILPQFYELEQSMEGLISGKRGLLRICLECNPCYELIVGVIGEFLKKWPLVDINVSKNFSFNGIEALLNRSIDMIITPDIYDHSKIEFYSVLDFNVLLVTSNSHPLISRDHVEASDLKNETIYTYPVDLHRLDLFSDFLIPNGIRPKKHNTLEDTEIILQLVSANRGISYLPEWLVEKYKKIYSLKSYKIGSNGIRKSLYLAVRKEDKDILYIKDFIKRCRFIRLGKPTG